MKTSAVLVAAAVALLVAVPAGVAADAAAPAPWTKCATFNAKYPHGVGKAKAKDKTSGTPVTTFKRSTKLYNLAMKKNGRLDGDKDGVACEQA